MVIGIDTSRIANPEMTGTEKYTFELTRHLLAMPAARKHDWILYVRGTQAVESKGQNRGANVKTVEIPLRWLWTQVGLAARTWIDGLDVLWIPAHTLPLLRRGFGGLGRSIKTVVTVHGLEYEWLPEYENWLQRWYLPLSTRYAVEHADRIIAVSGFTKRELVERLGADSKKMTVVHEGVESQRLRTRSQRLDREILKSYQLEARRYILFVGTVQPRKNLVRLIEAFSRLKGLGGQMKLVIAGKWGWRYEEVLAAPARWGVRDKVVFTRYISDADRSTLLKYATVYVQPSIVEGFGLPVLEAMTAGVPVASSVGGALSEVVGSAGLMFDPYDPADMTEKLSRVIGSSRLRRELIDRGQRQIRDFTWEKAAKRTYNILVKW